MGNDLTITPSGRLALAEQAMAGDAVGEIFKSLLAAFAESSVRGLLHLAGNCQLAILLRLRSDCKLTNAN